MKDRSIEPLLWMLFSAGGVIAALFLPILAFIFGIAIPLGWWPAPSYQQLTALAGHPISRVIVLTLCSLSLFHWAHRFRFTIYDGLQIKHLNEVLNIICYGLASAITLLAFYYLWMLPR